MLLVLADCIAHLVPYYSVLNGEAAPQKSIAIETWEKKNGSKI